MATHFGELREQLLRAGIAPRHVRRYLTELRDHLADLTAAEERAGHTRAEAESLSLARLGSVDALAQTMIARRELRSWTARAPWAVLSAGPTLGLVIGWGVALLILWSGWTWLLPGSPTPFVPVHGFAIIWFGVGRMLYYSAPLLAGWGMVLLAGRQRVQAVWPVIPGALAVALLGAIGSVDVRPPTLPGHAGDVGIRFYPPPSLDSIAGQHALVMFLLIAAPYLVWRWRNSRRDTEQP